MRNFNFFHLSLEINICESLKTDISTVPLANMWKVHIVIETVTTCHLLLCLMCFCCSPLETCATSQLVLVSTNTIYTVVAVLGVFLLSSAEF